MALKSSPVRPLLLIPTSLEGTVGVYGSYFNVSSG